VLIGVLLPALSKARQQSNTVKCASNIRQIMTGFVMYSQANKGLLPHQRIPQQFEWSRTTLATLIGESHMTGAQPKDNGCDYFRCPNDDIPRSTNPNYLGLQPRSYAINSANSAQYFNKPKYIYPWVPGDLSTIDFSTIYPIPCKLAKVPQRIFLVGEEYDQLKAANIQVSQMFVGQSTFHVLEGHFAKVHKGAGGMGGNYGFSDGHVEFHVPSDYKDNNGVIFTSAMDSNGDPRDPWKWITR